MIIFFIFLTYFEKLHIIFYQPCFITNMKDDSFRPVSKYKLFIIHFNYYKKLLYFFSSSIRMSGKSMNFDDKKIKKKQFLQKQKTIQDRWHRCQ